MNHLTSTLTVAVACFLTSSVFAQPSNAPPFERGVRIDVVASKPAEIKGGDWDDKTQNIELHLKFANLDTRQSYDNYTAVVYALGQSTLERNVRKVLLQEQVALTLAPRKLVEHHTKRIKTRYDKTGAIFGFMYDGWAIVVKDSAGKIVQVKSTSPTLEKMPEKVDKLTEGKCYDRNLQETDNPDGGRSS
ncbi:MAG: hypothetical protein ACOYOF_19190 [Verrucomicrobiaceae bacterium]